MFAAMLLAHGYRVACMTPNPQALEVVLRTHGVAEHADLHILATPPVTPPPPSLRERFASAWLWLCGCRGFSTADVTEESAPVIWRPTLRDRWRLNAHRYASKSPEVSVTPDLPPAIRIKRRLLHLGVPPIWYSIEFIRKGLRILRRASRCSGIRHPANLAAAAQASLTNLPWRPDFFLSMYADLWMTNPAYWRPASVHVPLPWGGIRFMPLDNRHAATEGYFRDPMFRGLCFLDEDAVACYQSCRPEKIFGFLPDVANAELSLQPSTIAGEIRRRAAGRPIILLCGSVEGRKNARLFCEAARQPGAEDFLFAIVGQLHPATLDREERALLDEFAATRDGNTFFHDIYFECEGQMNAVIAAADIIFAVYRDFPISSNMLSKAATFRKPILVSDRFLMGRRVRRYGIGIAVPEEDASAMLAGLFSIPIKSIPVENFERYCADFSASALAAHLDCFLTDCFPKEI